MRIPFWCCLLMVVLLEACGGESSHGAFLTDAHSIEVGVVVDARVEAADAALVGLDQALVFEADASVDVPSVGSSDAPASVDALPLDVLSELDVSVDAAAALDATVVDATPSIEAEPSCFGISHSAAQPVLATKKIGQPSWQGGTLVEGYYVLVAVNDWESSLDGGYAENNSPYRGVLEFRENVLTVWFMILGTTRDSWTSSGRYALEGSAMHLGWTCTAPGFMYAPKPGGLVNYTADGEYFIVDDRLMGEAPSSNVELVFKRQ